MKYLKLAQVCSGKIQHVTRTSEVNGEQVDDELNDLEGCQILLPLHE